MTELIVQSEGRDTPARRVSRRRGRDGAFTLTELLVVISIIVGMLAMAIPLYRVMSGSRSVEAGQNKMSAMLQRARARAIGMGDRRGVLFFKDQASGQMGMLLVKVVEPNTDTDSYTVDLDEENTDLELLPPGVGAVLCGPAATAGKPKLAYRRVGLIAFDAVGRLQQVFYKFRPTDPNDERFEKPTRLLAQYGDGDATKPVNRIGTDPLNYAPLPSGCAFLLYDAAPFANLDADPNHPEVDVSDVDTNPPVARPQRPWLDQNSTALVVNRYNGTLIRGNE